jgi:hypothetical protein
LSNYANIDLFVARSVHETVRSRHLAAFAAAGFRRRAVALVLPDPELFARQRHQYATDGKSVDELTMAEMRGTHCQAV